ncbi:MAG TPA: hypothetical protein PK400_11695 [Phycisphaerales bacterium]|nr:hypothetical protein [Phycisphaerales bacterium]HRQ75506.1 hypothetical protein [Phycisphaerales bacterium]
MVQLPIRCALAWLAVVICAAPNAIAEDPANAATWYARAIESMSRLTQADMAVLYEYEYKPGVAPTAEVRAFLSKVAPALDAFQRGSMQQFSDFGLDRSEGWSILLPHLHPMRQFARAIEMDVRVRLHDGDSSGAANRLAAAYRASQHMGDDRILISSLVGQAMFHVADQATQYALDTGAFNAGDAATLLLAMRQLEGADPFNYLESIIGEQEITVEWLPKQREEGELAEALAMAGADESDVSEWTTDEFHAQLDLYSQFMDGVIELFSMDNSDDARAAYQAMQANLIEGQYGVIVQLFAPAFDRILDQRDRGVNDIANRLNTLTELAEGRVHPAENLNAAYFYLRGIALLKSLSPEQLASLRTFTPEPDATIPDALADALLEMQLAIDEFRNGSLVRRCDFTLGQRMPHRAFIPEHAAGMSDALRLLLADAIHLLASEQTESAVDRLCILYRVIAHYSGDHQIVSSLVAHHAFNALQSIVASTIAEEHFNTQQMQRLAGAFVRIGRADPFGYSNAGRATREFLLRHLPRHFDLNDEAAAVHVRAMEEAIKTRSGDFLLNLLAFREEYHRVMAEQHRRDAIAAGLMSASPEAAPHDNKEEGKKVPPHALADVLNLEQLPELHLLAKGWVEQHNLRESQFIEDLARSRFANLSKRIVEARNDLRAAIALLNAIEVE